MRLAAMLSLIGLFFTSIFNLEELSVTVKLRDTEDKAPVNMAHVVNQRTGTEAYSDDQGSLNIEAREGDKLLVTHPSAFYGEFIVPEISVFTASLKRRYQYLPVIDMNNINDRDAILSKGKIVSNNLASYSKGWEAFYMEFINEMKNNPDFSKMKDCYNLHLMFGVLPNGQAFILRLKDVDQMKNDSNSLEAKIITSSFGKMDCWIPIKVEGVPVRQFFSLIISKEKSDFLDTSEDQGKPDGGK